MPRPPAGEPGPLPRADTFGRLLASSWRLHRAALRRLFWPYAAFAVALCPFPDGALDVLLVLWLAGGAPPTSLGIVLYVGAVAIPIALAGSYVACIGGVVMTEAVCDRHATVAEAASRVWRSRRDVFAAALVVALVSWGVVMLSGLGLAQVGAALTFVLLGPPVLAHVVVLEGRAFEPAVARARALLRGAALRAFVYLLAVGFVVLFALIFIVLAFNVAVATGNRTVVLTVYYAALALAGGLTIPYATAAGVTVYLELRAVKEGLDAPALCGERAGA